MAVLSGLFARTPHSALFRISALAVLLLALASYYLAELAAVRPAYNMGYLTMTQYSLMAVAMLTAWKSAPEAISFKDIRWLLVVAVLARVLLIDAGSYASNDVDRYLFDGRIAVEGLDPYRVSHDALQLQELRAQWQPPSEHAKYVTLYPPLALGLFSLAASFGLEHALLAWKLIILSASLATLFISAKVLEHAGKLQHLSLIAFSPLLILEANIGLHIDAISTFTVVAALYLWQRQRIALTGIAIGLGTAIKVVPIMLLLPLIFTLPSVKAAAKLVVSSLVTVVVIYLVTLNLGLHPVGSIGVFFEKWRFAAPLFVTLDQMFNGYQILIIMLIFAAVLALCIALFLWKKSLWKERQWQDKSQLFFAAQIAVAIPLLISPVIFPWYLMPLLPLLALAPNRYLILWTLLMPLTYEVLNGFLSERLWQPAAWPVWLVGLVQLAAVIAVVRYFYREWQHRKTINRDIHVQ
ncbi:MAG: glycosyltransferase 87 family protein [Psychrobium sp.]